MLSYKLFPYDILFIFFFYLNNFNITAFKCILNGNYIHTTLSAPWNFITIALIKKSNPKSFLCVNCCFSSFWLIIGYSYLNNFQSKYCHTKYLNLLFHPAFSALNFSCCKIDIYKCIDMHVLRSMYTYHYRFYIILVSIFFAPMRLRIYRFDWFCLELMQKHWVLILHLKTKYINRCQFIWWTIRQRLLAFLSLSSIAPPEIISSLPKSYFQIANSPIK